MAQDDIIYGMHAIRAALKRDPKRIKKVVTTHQHSQEKIQAILDVCEQKKILVDYVQKSEMEMLAKSKQHQGVAAFVYPKKASSEEQLVDALECRSEPAFFLVLDSVTDPHNLGACLRTADAVNVSGLIIPKDKSASVNATVTKVACGAAETVPIFQVTNLARTLDLLKSYNIWLYGLAGEAEQTIYETAFSDNIALIMGAEGAGLRHKTKQRCDFMVKIPMLGSVESLNVSVATGVTLYEVFRQRIS